MFDYMHDPDIRKLAVEWYMYGADARISEQTVLLGISVRDYLHDLATATEERAELDW